MIVIREKFKETLDFLASEDREYGLDTETSGLRWSDRLFILILYTGGTSYLFNFHSYFGEDESRILPRGWLADFAQIFDREKNTYFISNAKFDMGMLFKEGLSLKGTVVCTNALGRVLKNNYPDSSHYSLAASAERLGLQKNEDVEKYITKNKLFTWEAIPGKKKRSQLRRYQDVPMPIMVRYAEVDAELHFAVGRDLMDKIQGQADGKDCIKRVAENEIALTKVCFEMEKVGVKLDVEYTREALQHEKEKILDAEKDFREETGETFLDSNKVLASIFESRGIKPPLTDKGNPSFTDEALQHFRDPVTHIIRKLRYHQKRVSSFYSSFLYFADQDGIIHPNMRQGGTETGRFSYSDPNAQQLTQSEDVGEFSIRRCFVPRPGYQFVAIDYRAQEYRVLLDYAGERKLIKQVLDGADVHQATAELCGISRREAKTVNFAILYGAGSAKLAAQLGITDSAARDLKALYFSRLPAVKRLINQIIITGKTRGYIYTWTGRRCYISNPEWAYILPNHLIQGSAADVMKFAMVKIHEFLKPFKTRILLTIHDELLFELADGEENLVTEIKKIMESIYEPFNGMILEVDIKNSKRSFSKGDMQAWT